MEVWAIVTAFAVIIGIAAGIVQVVDYLEKRRKGEVGQPVRPSLPPQPAIPSNLPPRTGEFIGREKEVARVLDALASRWPLTCIDGIGGIGKTVLALEVVGKCLEASRGEILLDGIPAFDGFIWTTAKDRELTLVEVLDAIARTLDYPGVAQQPLEEKLESVRKLLQIKRYLLIVDNFETITDDAVCGFLLELPEPSKALVTSREQKLRQAWAVSLKGMEHEEALALIRSEGRRLGLTSVEQGNDQALLRLYKATGGAPLAMKWAVGQIKQRGQSLDVVLDYLYRAKGNVFETVFTRSWALLSDNSRCVLLVMPIFATSASKGFVEATGDVHGWDLDEALGQLVQMCLVDVSEELEEARRRYSVHPLTRAFAQSEAQKQAQFLENAQYRAARWLLDFAEEGKDDRSAFPRVEVEFPNILGSIEWCHRAGQLQLVVDFVQVLRRFLRERGYWNEAIELGIWAVEAAKNLGDRQSEAYRCVGPVSWVYRHREDLDEAERWCQRALEIFGDLDDESGLIWTELALGDIALRRRELGRAQEIFENVMRQVHQSNDRQAQSQLRTALHQLSHIACIQGEVQSAEKFARRAHGLSEQVHDELGLAAALNCLGRALYVQDRLDEAQTFYLMSLGVDERHGIRHGIAWNKSALALLEEKRGNLETALQLAMEAGELHHKLGMKSEMEQTLDLIERLKSKLAA